MNNPPNTPPPPIPPDRLVLRPREAAAALGISERTLWTWSKTRGLPTIRLGQTVRFPTAQLLEWIESQTHKNTDGQTGKQKEPTTEAMRHG